MEISRNLRRGAAAGVALSAMVVSSACSANSLPQPNQPTVPVEPSVSATPLLPGEIPVTISCDRDQPNFLSNHNLQQVYGQLVVTDHLSLASKAAVAANTFIESGSDPDYRSNGTGLFNVSAGHFTRMNGTTWPVSIEKQIAGFHQDIEGPEYSDLDQQLQVSETTADSVKLLVDDYLKPRPGTEHYDVRNGIAAAVLECMHVG